MLKAFSEFLYGFYPFTITPQKSFRTNPQEELASLFSAEEAGPEASFVNRPYSPTTNLIKQLYEECSRSSSPEETDDEDTLSAVSSQASSDSLQQTRRAFRLQRRATEEFRKPTKIMASTLDRSSTLSGDEADEETSDSETRPTYKARAKQF